MELITEINYFTLAVIIVVLIIETIAAYYFFKYYRLRRLILSTKTSRISDIRDGFHEIKGRVISLDQTLISPYCEIACVYYDFLVEEIRSVRRNPYESDDGKPEWDIIIKDKKMVRFGVDDGSGIAVVDLQYAKIEFKSENEFTPDLNHGMEFMGNPNQERVLKSYGLKSDEEKFERSLRYRELVLEEGIQVHVMGEVHGNVNGKPLFQVQGTLLFVSDNSEDELLKLYENRFAYSIVVMISVPLGLLLFWFMIVNQILIIF
ncbi:MAG: hypothetical protein IH585_15460 [Anaerolineaceae bacterium]|nr:hypothetical protein [Anaerolineaceae bacterium]